MSAMSACRRAVASAAVLITMGLTACATAPRDDGLSAQPPLREGWQSASHPLFLDGPGLAPATNFWRVPPLLPRGTYVVIRRDGDRAQLVSGHRFEVDSQPFKEIKLMLPLAQGSVEALDVKYLASATPSR